jgi:hypothetical protein
MLALRETFRVFTINALFIFERPFVFACAGACAGFGWHMDALMDIYIQRKKVVGFIQGDSYRGLCPPLTPYRGLRPPLTPWPTALRVSGFTRGFELSPGS